jgi:hypothetical protein
MGAKEKVRFKLAKTVVVVAVNGVATRLIAVRNELRADACGRSKGQGVREVQGARFQGVQDAPLYAARLAPLPSDARRRVGAWKRKERRWSSWP